MSASSSSTNVLKEKIYLVDAKGDNLFFNDYAPQDWDFLNFWDFIDPKGKKGISVKNINNILRRYQSALSWFWRRNGSQRVLKEHVNDSKEKFSNLTDNDINKIMAELKSPSSSSSANRTYTADGDIIFANNNSGTFNVNNTNSNNNGNIQVSNNKCVPYKKMRNGYYSSDDEKPRKKTKYDFTVYSGSRSYETKYLHWIINGKLNVTMKLMDFRRQSMEKHDQAKKTLTSVRLMSLNYIFYFPLNWGKSCIKYLPGTEQALIYRELSRKYQIKEFFLTRDVKEWGITVVEVFSLNGMDYDINLNPDQAELNQQRLLASFQAVALNNNDKTMVLAYKILTDIVGKSNSWSDPDKKMTESTVTRQYLDTFLDHIFCRDGKFHFKGENSMLEACRPENCGSDPFVEVFQPDFTAYTECFDSKFDVFVMEIKKPKSDNPGAYTDLNKTSKEMKDMLDMLISNKIPGPLVCGLLVSGAKCRTFVMNLEREAIYPYLELQKFNLITDICDVDGYWKPLQALLQVKDIIQKVKGNVELHIKNLISSAESEDDEDEKDQQPPPPTPSSSTSNPTVVPIDWCRRSFGRPEKINAEDEEN